MKEGERKTSAKKIYNELRLMQNDPIKTCLGPIEGTGVVFFPYGGFDAYSVELTRSYPNEQGLLSLPQTKELVVGRGDITDADASGGITHIIEGIVEDPATIYEGFGDPKTIELQQYITQNGKICQIYPTTETRSPEELSVYTISAIERFGQLLKVPHRIHEEFGTYENFREALGAVKTNGIDHYDPRETDDESDSWNLFRREGALPQLVEKAAEQSHPKQPNISL